MSNMRIVLVYILFSTLGFSQSENQERTYYFDTYELLSVKDFSNNIYGKSHRFTNSKDSSYSLELRYEENNNNTAHIMINKNRTERIAFDLDFEYTKPDDLNKLTNSKLYTVVFYGKTSDKKKIVDDITYENDSLNNQTVVHIKQFKNKKKKKLIKEIYYSLSKNNSLLNDSTIKLSFTQDELLFLNKLNIDKIVSVNSKNEITDETTFLAHKNIDFTFTFKIDEVFPKHN